MSLMEQMYFREKDPGLIYINLYCDSCHLWGFKYIPDQVGGIGDRHHFLY
jgi:hypothetical protein